MEEALKDADIITEAVSCKEGEARVQARVAQARSAGHLYKYLQYGA